MIEPDHLETCSPPVQMQYQISQADCLETLRLTTAISKLIGYYIEEGVCEGYSRGILRCSKNLPIKLRRSARCTPSQSWNQHQAKHG